MRFPFFVLILLVTSWLSGCGGGGGGGGDDGDNLNDDATLSGLTLSSGQLDQVFQPESFEYTSDAIFLQPSITVTATATDVNASIQVNGVRVGSGEASAPITLDEGANAILVKVVAEDGASSETYTIMVTRQTGASFAQQAYIKASNTEAGDQFGWRLAISGNTLAVGAYSEASNGDDVTGDAQLNNDEGFAGAVYVFTRNSGTWSQQAYIKASNAEAGDNFGYSLALSGDTLAVGAYGEASNGTGVNSGEQDNNDEPGSGAVYVFTRSAGSWSQQAYIKASNTEGNDRFGWQLAISGDTLAVGAWGEDSAGIGVNSGAQSSFAAPDSGAVYVFTRSAGIWSQQAYIKASNTGGEDFFGYSLALDADTLAVGAWGEDSNGVGVNSGAQGNDSRPGSGAVYLFTRTATGWSQQAYIKASNTDANDLFGFSLAVSGDTLAVGAHLEASNGIGVNGGAAANDDLAGAGAVYLFTRAADSWSQQAYIKASNTDAGDRFGYSLALDGDILAIGADREDGNGAGINSAAQSNDDLPDSGAVYLFARTAASWQQLAYVKASNTGAGDFFGRSLATTADTLAVGAYGEASKGLGVNSATQLDDDQPLAGAVYVFR